MVIEVGDLIIGLELMEVKQHDIPIHVIPLVILDFIVGEEYQLNPSQKTGKTYHICTILYQLILRLYYFVISFHHQVSDGSLESEHRYPLKLLLSSTY